MIATHRTSKPRARARRRWLVNRKKIIETFSIFPQNPCSNISPIFFSREKLFLSKSTRVHGQRSQRNQNTTQKSNGGPTCHQNKRRRRQRQPDAHNTTRHGGEDAGAKVHLRESRNPATCRGRRFLEWLELFDLAMTINGSEDAHKKGYLIPKHQRSKKKEDMVRHVRGGTQNARGPP